MKRFTVKAHWATRLHYDLRLEPEVGVFMCPSEEPAHRRRIVGYRHEQIPALS